MFCSTIIPTVGRDTLTRAVESVLSQDQPASEFEVIVVNDSGNQLPKARWMQSPQVSIVSTMQRERSVARNTGATMAKGRFLHFLDDDDWLASKAFYHLWMLANQSNSALLYGSSQLLDRQEQFLIKLHHRFQGNCFLPVMAGEWIPLQASLIESRVFFKVGGFNPLLVGPEDIDLLRRIALYHDLSGTEHLVANIIWGDVGSTTNYKLHSQQSRCAREQILDDPATYNRLRTSTCLKTGNGTSGWLGRILRIYLTSAMWNCQHRILWKACSRIVYALVTSIFAGPHLLSKNFWHSVSFPYASETFTRGQEVV